MTMRLSRRRLITLSAVATGIPAAWFRGSAKARPAVWSGIALGAPARLTLYHEDAAAARTAIRAALAELRRLETIFSLYRPDSALSQLNRQGQLADAPSDLIQVTARALAIAALTDGTFDPTVQPLWRLMFDHFTGPNPDPTGPAAHAFAAAKALVDWRAVRVSETAGTIAFDRPGMALTLNGVAQGAISDRVAAVLRTHGFERMLVDMGEPVALSTHPDGRAWRIGIADPRHPDHAATVLDVEDCAVASSGGYGTVLDEAGRFTHLIDPRSGRTAPAETGVTVITSSAERADAFSTALAVASPDERRSIVDRAEGIKVLFLASNGSISVMES